MVGGRWMDGRTHKWTKKVLLGFTEICPLWGRYWNSSTKSCLCKAYFESYSYKREEVALLGLGQGIMKFSKFQYDINLSAYLSFSPFFFVPNIIYVITPFLVINGSMANATLNCFIWKTLGIFFMLWLAQHWSINFRTIILFFFGHRPQWKQFPVEICLPIHMSICPLILPLPYMSRVKQNDPNFGIT